MSSKQQAVDGWLWSWGYTAGAQQNGFGHRKELQQAAEWS